MNDKNTRIYMPFDRAMKSLLLYTYNQEWGKRFLRKTNFHDVTNMERPWHKNLCPMGHKIYNVGTL